MSFAAMKRNRTDLSKIIEAVGGNDQKTNDNNDDRFWKPTIDKAKNGYAVVRFLPGTEGDTMPFVKYFDHFFKGPTGQWYVEKSLTSIKLPDPLSEANSKLWNEDGSEEAKRIVRERKRQLRHVANVLIVSDPSNPENEGKVKLFRFGKKIMDKIQDSLQPRFPDEQPMNPFNMWEGADFVIKIRNVEGYANYDASTFKAIAPIPGSDDELEAIYNQQHSLKEWYDPSEYKTYDELKNRLAIVLGESSNSTRKFEDLDDEIPNFDAPKPMAAQSPPSVAAVEVPTAESSMDDDETMKYFSNMLKED